MYTIKTVAEKTGLSAHTIRFYAREELLPTIKRNKNGVRVFRDEDLEAIYIIECLKNCGMKISEIKSFTEWTMAGDSTIDKRLKLFQEKYLAMKDKIKQMNETLDALRYKVWFYETAKEFGSVEIHDKMSTEDIPVEMREIRERMKHVERIIQRNFWMND